MKRLRKLIYAMITVVVLVGITSCSSSEYDFARITGLDYSAVVVDEAGSNGKVVITEQLTFDIHAADEDNGFWELWRELPESYVDGVKVEYNVISVKQIFEDGSVQVFEESTKLYWDDEDFVGYDGKYGPGKWFHSKGPYDGYTNFECLLIYVDGLYRETPVFEIQYEMSNAALRYNDASELYLSLYYGDSINYLDSVKGEILFPLDKMPREGNYEAFTYGTNAHEFPFEESTSKNEGYHTFFFELDESQLTFKSFNQYIEFALIAFGEDRHVFTQFASQNNYFDQDMLPSIRAAQAEFEQLPIVAAQNRMKLFVGSIIGTFGVMILALFINFIVKKTNPMYKPSMHIDYFRDIPNDLDANFARKLVFAKTYTKDNIGDGYAAAMLSLVHKGYVDVEQINPSKGWSQKNVKIHVRNDVPNESQINPVQKPVLTPVEERYFNLILRHAKSGEITQQAFQNKISSDYEYTNRFVQDVKTSTDRIGIVDGYFKNKNYKSPKYTMLGFAITFVVIGILVMIIGNLSIYQTRLELAYGAFFILGFGFILSGLYMAFVSRNYILLTQFGQDEYEKWHGLYKFLNSETLMKERTILELALWEKYLIYATAFGISEKVVKALEIRCPEAVMNSSPILRNPHFRTRAFYATSRNSFSSATRSASFTARSGGHGGYGGGGRGGGGGGGGH